MPASRTSLLGALGGRPIVGLLLALGLLQIVAALGLWVWAALAGWSFAPGPAHVALVLQAFQACFLLGGLLLVLPGWLRAPASGPGWTLTALALAVTGCAAIVLGRFELLPWLLPAQHGLALGLLLRCLLVGSGGPDARIALLGLALGAGVLVDLLLLLDRGQGLLPPWLLALAGDYRLQGLPLLVGCGLAGLLLRPDGRPLPRPEWPLLLGLGLLLSYPLAAVAEPGTLAWRGAWLLRALSAALLLAPALRARPPGAEALALRCALLWIPLGLLLMACFPQYRLAWQHLVFVTGLLWLLLLALGRTWRRASPPRAWMLWTWSGLLIVATLTRIGAEWSAESYALHLWLGAALGLAALALWPWAYLPQRLPRQAD